VDAIIEVEGQAARSGLISVFWNGEVFSVFNEDLQEKAQIVNSTTI
jgi:hypothetical protein